MSVSIGSQAESLKNQQTKTKRRMQFKQNKIIILTNEIQQMASCILVYLSIIGILQVNLKELNFKQITGKSLQLNYSHIAEFYHSYYIG